MGGLSTHTTCKPISICCWFWPLADRGGACDASHSMERGSVVHACQFLIRSPRHVSESCARWCVCVCFQYRRHAEISEACPDFLAPTLGVFLQAPFLFVLASIGTRGLRVVTGSGDMFPCALTSLSLGVAHMHGSRAECPGSRCYC